MKQNMNEQFSQTEDTAMSLKIGLDNLGVLEELEEIAPFESLVISRGDKAPDLNEYETLRKFVTLSKGGKHVNIYHRIAPKGEPPSHDIYILDLE